jgi:hypothetical protein
LIWIFGTANSGRIRGLIKAAARQLDEQLTKAVLYTKDGSFFVSGAGIERRYSFQDPL